MATIDDLEDLAKDNQISFAEAMEKYAPVHVNYDPVHGSYIVMAERDPQIDADLALRELGYSSPSPWTAWTREERVPELRDKKGLRTYYDMKRADGTIRGALRLLKTPVMSARWFVEPASDSTIDKNIAEYVEDNLFRRLNVPWSRVVEDALLMCEYGYMPFEKVFDYDPKNPGRIMLTKLAPRHPIDVREWAWDDNGGPDGLVMEPMEINGFRGSTQFSPFSNRNSTLRGFNVPGQTLPGFGADADLGIYIPISKLVIFVLEQEAGDLRGISILRSAYKHYFYKDTFYKIDAIQKERHGVGVPVIKLPVGFSQADKTLAENLGRNLRTNERAHIVIPNNWEVLFAKLEGQPVDCLKSIEHHDLKIKSNILAPFMDESNVRPDSLDIYFKSTRYIASTICDTFNHHVIPQLVDMNFSRGGYPQLRVRRIGEWEDIRTMSFAFRNFVGAGAIRPDDELEEFLRSELDLPPVDKDSVRMPETPQLANTQKSQTAKPPRQATAKASVPGANAGGDRSGG